MDCNHHSIKLSIPFPKLEGEVICENNSPPDWRNQTCQMMILDPQKHQDHQKHLPCHMGNRGRGLLFQWTPLPWELKPLIEKGGREAWWNQVLLNSNTSGIASSELLAARSAQFEGIVPLFILVTANKSSSKTTWNWGDTSLVLRLWTRATEPA